MYMCKSSDPFSVERVGHPLPPCIGTPPKQGSKTARQLIHGSNPPRQQGSRAARQARQARRARQARQQRQAGQQRSKAARQQASKTARQQTANPWI